MAKMASNFVTRVKRDGIDGNIFAHQLGAKIGPTVNVSSYDTLGHLWTFRDGSQYVVGYDGDWYCAPQGRKNRTNYTIIDDSPKPTQADVFRAFMVMAWEDGDKIEFENALVIAKVMGATPMGQVLPDDDDGVDWLFPDGSIVTIITRDGHGSGIS